jgi:hypothetical protein
MRGEITTMMKGLGMMLKSLGVNIDPQQVETIVETAKVAIPELVKYTHDKFDSIDQRLATMEQRLDNIESTVADCSIAISQLKEVWERHFSASKNWS